MSWLRLRKSNIALFADGILGSVRGRAVLLVSADDSANELVPHDIKARYPNDKTGQINTVLGKNPLLFDRYLSDAIEVDVDCLADGRDTYVAGIMEHIEEAGSHSGDSGCGLPPHSCNRHTKSRILRRHNGLPNRPSGTSI